MQNLAFLTSTPLKTVLEQNTYYTYFFFFFFLSFNKVQDNNPNENVNQQCPFLGDSWTLQKSIYSQHSIIRLF